MNDTGVPSYGEIILKESLIDFVKACHGEEYVAIFDLVPTMEDFNIKVYEFSKNTCSKKHGIIDFSMVLVEAN